MKFTLHSFSKRKPAVECAVFVIHEAPQTAYRATGAAIILRTGRVFVGVCACSPSDMFARKVGRDKAVGRAYQNLLDDHGYVFVGIGEDVDRNCIASIKVAVEENIAASKAAMVRDRNAHAPH